MASQTTKGGVGGYSWFLLVIGGFWWLYRVLVVVIAGPFVGHISADHQVQ